MNSGSNDNQRKYFYDTVYNTSRWKRLRNHHIALNPLCACCSRGHLFCTSGMTTSEALAVEGYGKNRVSSAYIVDHILPLWYDIDLAFEANNLRSYCLSCHSRKTTRVDTMLKKKLRIGRVHDDLEDFG